jgi:hypothetical protein
VNYSKFLTALLTPERVEGLDGHICYVSTLLFIGVCLRDSLVRGKFGVYTILISSGVIES